MYKARAFHLQGEQELAASELNKLAALQEGSRQQFAGQQKT
jgi:hypothetical protein